MISRILFIAIFIGFVYFLVSSLQRKKQIKNSSRGQPEQEHMVSCHHCGLHTPEDQAVRYEGFHYCSLQHAQIAERR